MEQQRFSTIAHRHLSFLTPIFPDKVGRLLDSCGIFDGMRVADFGCGKGAFLIEISKRARVAGTGLDMNADFIEAARQAARESGALHAPEFLIGKTEDAKFDPESLDMAICTGATHAFGSLKGTLKAFGEWLAPSGIALVGEGYWRARPSPEYLAFLGGLEEEIHSLGQTLELAQSAGFELVYATTSNEEEWDHYESRYANGVLTYCRENPDDPASFGHINRIRAWNDAYWKWGREALGLAWMVLRKNPAFGDAASV